MNGHIAIVKFLLTVEVEKADVHAQDADGWTALHNACSKGYLDIVRFLCEKAGAAEVSPHDPGGVRGVDKKSKGGWTPLSEWLSFPSPDLVKYIYSSFGS